MLGTGEVTIDPSACVRCAACAAVAPAVFELSRKGIRVLRPPADRAEAAACRAAALICPTRAIAYREVQ